MAGSTRETWGQGDDGYVTLQGRAHELIISGGFKIYPRESGGIARRTRRRRRSRGGWRTRSLRGESPWYLRTATASRLNDADFNVYCGERLASFKVPRHFVSGGVVAADGAGKDRNANTGRVGRGARPLADRKDLLEIVGGGRAINMDADQLADAARRRGSGIGGPP